MNAEEILQFVNERISNRPQQKPSGLYDPISYVLSLGGKRIRPVLMLLAYSLYKDDPLSIIEQAIGLETYHNFTLLHDDVMDNAPMRRGQPGIPAHRTLPVGQASRGHRPLYQDCVRD